MSIPVRVLLRFDGWTLLILFSTIGAYCWRRILTGKGLRGGACMKPDVEFRFVPSGASVEAK